MKLLPVSFQDLDELQITSKNLLHRKEIHSQIPLQTLHSQASFKLPKLQFPFCDRRILKLAEEQQEQEL